MKKFVGTKMQKVYDVSANTEGYLVDFCTNKLFSSLIHKPLQPAIFGFILQKFNGTVHRIGPQVSSYPL